MIRLRLRLLACSLAAPLLLPATAGAGGLEITYSTNWEEAGKFKSVLPRSLTSRRLSRAVGCYRGPDSSRGLPMIRGAVVGAALGTVWDSLLATSGLRRRIGRLSADQMLEGPARGAQVGVILGVEGNSDMKSLVVSTLPETRMRTIATQGSPAFPAVKSRVRGLSEPTAPADYNARLTGGAKVEPERVKGAAAATVK